MSTIVTRAGKGSPLTNTEVDANFTNLNGALSPLAKAIRVALLASASVRTLQVLDDADLDMGTNNFSVVVQKRITTTRPAANEILYHKHDGATGIIVTLLTTGIVRLTLNGANFDSTAALTSASNVEPVIIIPVTRETTSAAGSVTFVVDGIQLGTAVTITAHGSTADFAVNGGFATDTDWTKGTGWSIGSGVATKAAGTASALQQTATLVAGMTYLITVTVTRSAGNLVPRLYGGTDASGTTISASGTYTRTIVANSGNTQFGFSADSVFAGTVDVVSIVAYPTADNASNLYLLGTSTTTTEGSYYDGAIYNRALSVAECLNYCLRGPDALDMSGSNTNFFTGDSINFEGGTVGSWAANTGNGVTSVAVNAVSPISGTYDLLVVTNGLSNSGIRLDLGAVVLGEKYRLVFDYKGAASSAWNVSFRNNSNPTSGTAWATSATGGTTWQPATAGTFVYEFTSTLTTANGRVHIANSSVDTIQLDNFRFVNLGITGHWPAFNAQTNTGQLADRSGNKNHMMLPASGATILGDRRPDVQLTWDNTWAATSELQYFPGVNQAAYPVNFYFEGIILTPSATTTAGFTIGNGSNASYYATVSGPLTAGVPVFVSLANRYSDGTNLKLTITPMATTTCTLSTTVFGRLLGGF